MSWAKRFLPFACVAWVGLVAWMVTTSARAPLPTLPSSGEDAATHIAGSGGPGVPVPAPGDAGTYLGSNGQGVTPSWSTPPTITSLEFFSPVTVTEGINSDGLHAGGGGFFIRSNTGNPPSESVGASFYVTQPGHSCSGARFYYLGYDGTYETCTYVKLSLWQAYTATRLATVTISASANGEYSGSWGAVTLTQGTSYVVSAFDESGGGFCGGSDAGTGCCASAGTCCHTSYTYMNATTAGAALGAMVGFAPVAGGPWVIWAPYTPSGGTRNLGTMFSAISTSDVDGFPDTTVSEFMPIEPVLQ